MKVNNMFSNASGQSTTSTPRIASLNIAIGNLLPPFEWVEIPGGKVTLEAGGSLSKATTFDVLTFTIAKYPITNAQFEMFANSPSGYDSPKWWEFSDAAKKWHAQNPKPKKRAFPEDDHPRANVSWYEAIAFCCWLTGIVASEGSLSPLGAEFALPTEQQWQRAAQGDDRRAYPWGNEFDTKKANTSEGKIGKTTLVTQYPQGASPYGVCDMSGNVYEWCLTRWETGTSDLETTGVRVLRGGSFHYRQSRATATFRYALDPFRRYDYFGFRVAVA